MKEEVIESPGIKPAALGLEHSSLYHLAICFQAFLGIKNKISLFSHKFFYFFNFHEPMLL